MLLLRFRTFIIRYKISAIVAVMFIFSSCSKQTITKQTTPNPKLHTAARNAAYSNEDVFRGVVFLDGPVATNLLSEYDNISCRSMTNDPAVLAQLATFENNIITTINSNDPAFLNNFRDAIGSGDLNTVKAMLVDAGQKVYQATLVMQQTTDPQAQPIIQQFITQFTSTYSITPSSSQSDLSTAMHDAARSAHPSDVWVVFYIAVAVVVAAVAIFAAVLGAADANTNSYLTEKYRTDLTLNMVGI